jgi:pyrimidine-nucleoside phosphorylase
MHALELITRKRDGGRLSDEEIAWAIATYTKGGIPEYQMAALLMAIVWQGLDAGERSAWTDAMLHSGDVLDLSSVDRPKVDKHSTGGVGDKISLSLAPLVAACGVAVPMISGRGLAHTGGTLDKLESIPGFRVGLEPDEIPPLLEENGVVMAAASKTLVPADQKLYALRDATGTVPAIGLITSSIMSKKLAEDLDGLVLDVKVGNGANMADPRAMRELARTMVQVGADHDTPVKALVTEMSQPLGAEVGNANEVAESIAVLRGDGPSDVTELTIALGAEMLLLAGMATDEGSAREQLTAAIGDGTGLEVMERMIEAQDGDPGVVSDPTRLPTAPGTEVLTAQDDGVVTECHARRIGVSAIRLGAGRETKKDRIDPGVGITVHAKVGDRVERGDTLATVHWRDESRLAECLAELEQAWVIGESATPPPLIHERIG